ncbi:MAG: hypothetical protein KAU62_02205 [Candidatus Heimdallarchaeota archaeon]|nr:hypothetical protein [Candidatus Heimdallarchaeota archaeon]MCG3254872.1 hypothetical protein [Candidatus Heimdallarchaeota archaeon]MCK4609947.1 hypothetical protein [Candidatus Heimdallarchaeota archaeon]
MIKPLGKYLTLILIAYICVSSINLSVSGNLPVIASRVSEVSEIAVITNLYNKPNSTLFGIGVTVEILNRAEENQTVVELSDFYPKVFINATLSNQTLVIDPLMIAHATIMHYSYAPGITVEHSYVKFYINQSGLSQPEDGNYTLWRPINTGYFVNNITTLELPALIKMNSGNMNVTYIEFDYYPTEQTNVSFALPLLSILLICTVIFAIRKKNSNKR